MPLSNKDMLRILESTDFRKNKGRTNNLQPGQTHSESMVLGKVRQLYTSCNGKVCKVEATKNKKFPIMLKAAKQFLRENTNYKFEAVMLLATTAAVLLQQYYYSYMGNCTPGYCDWIAL